MIKFNTSDQLDFYEYPTSYIGRLITSQVFRDVSSWYHIVCVWDSANATAGNRMRLYVNGVEVTTFATDTNPPLNQNSTVNVAASHRIGNYQFASWNFNGYLADVWFLDSATPATTTRTVNGVTETILSDFGEFDATTGVWNPKAYTGSVSGNRDRKSTRLNSSHRT